jgi:putative peptidoglycan lipid II flippase
MGVAALMTGALNAMKVFAAPAFAPMLLNVAMIAAPFVFAPLATRLGLPLSAGLAIAAMVGGVLQLAVQVPAMKREGLLLRPRWDLSDPYVKKAFALLVPLLLGLGVYQLNVALSRRFTSYLPHGAMSYLYYGQRLVEIPQGMFALAVASAALPSISETVARGETDDAKRIFRDALRLSLFVAIPSSIGLMALATPAVSILFGRGLFGAEEIAETGRSLFFQAAGIWAVASVRTVVPMFHGMKDTRTPVAASAINLFVFGLSAFLLVRPLGHAGVAAAISLASIAQLVALITLLRLKVGRLGFGEVGKSSALVLLASLAAGATMSGVARLGDFGRGGNDPRNVAVFLAAGALGILVFLVAGKALGVRELDVLVRGLTRRFRRT